MALANRMSAACDRSAASGEARQAASPPRPVRERRMSAHAVPSAQPALRKPFYANLYVQVLVAIALGIALGQFYPELGASLKPLGDAFVKLVKMIIAPVIFLTVATGIAGMSDLKKVGRV